MKASSKNFYETILKQDELTEMPEVLKELPKDLLEVLAEIDAKRNEIYVGNKWVDGSYLSQVRVKLAALKAYLGEWVARYGYDAATQEGHYKVTREGVKLELLDKVEGMTASRADSEKIVKTQEELHEVNKADYIYSLLRNKREDTQTLIDQVAGRISDLKHEERNER